LFKCLIFNSIQASNVIKLFNNWFNLLNTQLPKDKFILSYGLDLDNQNKILSEMNKLIENKRVYLKGKQTTCLKPFQKGIVQYNMYIIVYVYVICICILISLI
jgi:hypothetical protein